jgi:hypothetical protein
MLDTVATVGKQRTIVAVWATPGTLASRLPDAERAHLACCHGIVTLRWSGVIESAQAIGRLYSGSGWTVAWQHHGAT